MAGGQGTGILVRGWRGVLCGVVGGVARCGCGGVVVGGVLTVGISHGCVRWWDLFGGWFVCLSEVVKGEKMEWIFRQMRCELYRKMKNVEVVRVTA